jgi:hypothetical protein
MKLANSVFVVQIICVVLALIGLFTNSPIQAAAALVVSALAGAVVWYEFWCAWKWM